MNKGCSAAPRSKYDMKTYLNGEAGEYWRWEK